MRRESKDDPAREPTVRQRTVRMRRETDDDGIVSADDHSAGGIDFDDLGQARWKWVTESGDADQNAEEGTFDYLKALDNSTLAIADDGETLETEPKSGEVEGSGYDPYDTVNMPGPVKFRRR